MIIQTCLVYLRLFYYTVYKKTTRYLKKSSKPIPWFTTFEESRYYLLGKISVMESIGVCTALRARFTASSSGAS